PRRLAETLLAARTLLRLACRCLSMARGKPSPSGPTPTDRCVKTDDWADVSARVQPVDVGGEGRVRAVPAAVAADSSHSRRHGCVAVAGTTIAVNVSRTVERTRYGETAYEVSWSTQRAPETRHRF